MSRDDATRRLRHDLRDALSAVRMNLQTLEALETRGEGVTAEKRLAVLARAREALDEAVAVAERVGAGRE